MGQRGKIQGKIIPPPRTHFKNRPYAKACTLQGRNLLMRNFASLAPATASRLCILFFCFFLTRARKGKFFGVFYLHLYTNLSEQSLKPRSGDFVCAFKAVPCKPCALQPKFCKACTLQALNPRNRGGSYFTLK